MHCIDFFILLMFFKQDLNFIEFSHILIRDRAFIGINTVLVKSSVVQREFTARAHFTRASAETREGPSEF